MFYLLNQLAQWLAHQPRWEKFILAGFIIIAPFLAFYNLEFNPRIWHDEGAFMGVSKTLAQDGVYASGNSDGYQTFGAIQSVGPTVILPIALSFKLFGVGLLQGRAVMGLFMLLTLAAFYLVGQELFGRRVALIAIFFLISSPAVGFLLIGRQVVGEMPALGFFLWGWLVWAKAMRAEQPWLYPIAGLLLGAAMITKMQFAIMGFGALLGVAVLDLFFYRQRKMKMLVIIGVTALTCVLAWWFWQLAYFGTEIFQANAEKLRQLAAGTTGFDLRLTVEAFKFLLGSGSGHFYYFWGFLALGFTALLCFKRDSKSLLLSFLLIFTVVWLAYYIFWITPWPQAAYPPMVLSALFVGKLWHDLAGALLTSRNRLFSAVQQLKSTNFSFPLEALIMLGSCVGLTAFFAATAYDLQREVRDHVLDAEGGRSAIDIRTPPQLQNPHEMAAWLNEKVAKEAIIETWERELSILTDHTFHFPDQALIGQGYAVNYRDGSRNYVLGEDYFRQYQVSYVVIGWYAKLNQIYDMDFLEKNAQLVTTVGLNDWQYDVYKLDLASIRTQTENGKR